MDDLTRAAAQAQRMYERLDHSDSGKRYDEVFRERDRMEWRVQDRFEEVWEDVEHHHASTRQRHKQDSTMNGGRSSMYSYEPQQRPSQQPRSRPTDDWQSRSQVETFAPRHDFQTREVRPSDHRQQDLPSSGHQGFTTGLHTVRQSEPVSHRFHASANESSQSQHIPHPPGYDTALAESRRAIEAFLNDDHDPPPEYSSYEDQPRRKDRRKQIRAKDHEKALSWLAGRTTLGGNRRG